MVHISPPLDRILRMACVTTLALSYMSTVKGQDNRTNLALNKPASSSSIENDEHNAAQANDGDPDTCWRADDEPENGAEWWQVDLGKPIELSGCQIRWPYEGKIYRYKVEGSADKKHWMLLSDQTKTTSKSQEHDLNFENVRGVRYVRVTVTGFEEGCWASICEVKLFGKEHDR